VTKIEEIITAIKAELVKKSTIERYRVSEEYFTRNSKLGFYKTVLLGIQLMKGSLSVELHIVMDNNNLEEVTKSAYTQSRYKISSEIYLKVNAILLESVYKPDETDMASSSLSVKRFLGYKIDAIDGTKVTLPNTEELRKHFGTQSGGSKTLKTETAMCLLMCRYDVLNHYIRQMEVSELGTGELSIAKSWAKSLDGEAITLFDRGFGSMFFCFLLQKHEKPFLIRVKLGFNKVVKAFVESDQNDSIVTFEAGEKESYGDETMPKGTKIQVRLVKIWLPNGKLEVLMTSLFDTELFSLDVLNKLYQLRWGIETAYDRLKNQLLLMCFSGLKVEAIYQDIYATIFVHNLQQLLVNEAQITVDETTTHCEHEYQVNNNVATGILKNKIMTLFLTHEPKQIVQKLITLFSKNREPKRLNRYNKEPPKRAKSLAKRRNLVTQANFRRAF
jgi:hypothetical protein